MAGNVKRHALGVSSLVVIEEKAREDPSPLVTSILGTIGCEVVTMALAEGIVVQIRKILYVLILVSVRKLLISF
ncbi:hypothetical protein MA16_Dca018157 [Dendrobium catenatum]|uniref:Uncharacterized protein n=1 Tax=Dendrobium catenatum TaxID=906689 RepID=A0A2I0VSS1_9ASPA|nr:hypothetical protein MA16_Dca018157 [Dendrobium catenatum]